MINQPSSKMLLFSVSGEPMVPFLFKWILSFQTNGIYRKWIAIDY